MIKSLSSFFEAQTPRGGQAACYLSIRAAAQGAPGGKFPYFRLRPAENGRSPLNHAAAARPPCTKPYNHPKIMQIYSFFALAPRRRPLPHRYPIPAPASPCRARAFPRRDCPKFRRRATKPLPGNAAAPCAARKINFPKGIR